MDSPKTMELLAEFRREVGHCLNIKDSAQKTIDALNKIINGLGNSKPLTDESIKADCKALLDAQNRMVDCYKAFFDYMEQRANKASAQRG